MTQSFRTILAGMMLVLWATSLSAQGTFWRHLEQPFAGSARHFITAPNGDLLATTEKGLAMSRDDGATWREFGGLDSVEAYPTLVTRAGTFFYVTLEDGGIYRSTDNGVTWSQAAGGALNDRPGMMIETRSGAIVMAAEGGIYRSTNSGTDWVPSGENPSILMVAISPDGALYASTNAKGLIRSTDDGASWQPVGNLPTRRPTSFLFRGAGEMLVGTDTGIYRSVDRGASFTPFALIGVRIDPNGLAALPGGELVVSRRDSGLYRLSSDGSVATRLATRPERAAAMITTASGTIIVGYNRFGIIRSTDRGATFTTVGLPRSLEVGPLAEAPDGSIYAGSRGSALYRTVDRGETWSNLEKTSAVGYFLAFGSADLIFAAGAQNSVVRSTDRGAGWEILPVDVGNVPSGVLVARSGAVLVSERSNGIVRSTDNGISWRRGLESQAINDIASTPEGEIWALGVGRIFRSQDDGATWDTLLLEGPAAAASYLENIAAPAEGYIVIGGVAGNNSGTIVRSTDAGTTWESVPFACTAGTPRIERFAGSDLFATTRCGIYRSTDNGETWSMYAPLPPNEEDGGTLLLDSRGELWFGGDHGVYTASVPSRAADRKEKEEKIALEVHPNPMATNGRISFHLTVPGDVTIALKTLLGETTTTLLDRRLDAGDHTIIIDPHVPSGTYMLYMRAGDRVATEVIGVVR